MQLAALSAVLQWHCRPDHKGRIVISSEERMSTGLYSTVCLCFDTQGWAAAAQVAYATPGRTSWPQRCSCTASFSAWD
jgi:hypothetical protein